MQCKPQKYHDDKLVVLEVRIYCPELPTPQEIWQCEGENIYFTINVVAQVVSNNIGQIERRVRGYRVVGFHV